MKNIVKNEIFKVLGREFILEKPKDKNLAHYATPIAFSMAKELKKSPMLIADELVSKFQNSDIFDVSAVNGYINFKLKNEFLDKISNQTLKLDVDFAKGEKKNESVFIEYISANPTGPLHIGHVRGAVFGDTLANIGEYLGYDVTTEYYINDAGNQIDLLGISVSLAAKEFLFNESVVYPESYYRGEYLNEISKLALDKFGKDIFYDKNRNLELAEFAKDEVLKIIKKDLADVGIFIQNWASEKSLYLNLNPTIEKLKKSGQMYEKDGATYIASTKLNDDNDRVVVRNDGRPTYLAGDIIYHDNKFEKSYDRYINIWGADHHGYIARIKAAINFLGYDEDKLEVILMQMVSLLKDGKPFKMSKRAGTSVLMSEIVEDIGSDALRFMFISKSNTSPLEFELNALKQNDSSNPIFYINYAHARVNQIFTKANKTVSDVLDVSLDSLDENAKNLLFEALTLNEVLQDVYSSRGLHKLTDFLKSLSSNFHKFYNENRVVGAKNEDALLKLFAIVALCIRTTLKLMGIKAKEKM
ncbi:arginine--tRNA ligase [Campylobacter pinnipediorum]|uniref:Arginine--tRNA ligase n=1 Tax=Campylobacter pinnipediorum subsp. pinnipediorum TaxID=1660067 RepID=A0AAX0L9F3_9BACT|nr:arginine--tRNA ligase [Campylobacter pinnipediorum]AQW84141.1 arginyl-tRNA synthetase [Campylobacter pinnipediorum subsp. pinnipediorum]OPA74850.1 arginine--tRNA ligase [Campylobacter pinnipediorum subsp. pinnipediorum]